MARKYDARRTLARNRRRALRQSQAAQKRLLNVLGKAQRQLAERLRDSAELRNADGSRAFSVAQMTAVQRQVQDLQRFLSSNIDKVIRDVASITAEGAAEDTIRYLEQAERQFTGVGRALGLKTAAVLNRASKKTESSVLRRIRKDKKHPANEGVVRRYSNRVVRHFEETLMIRMIARQPWGQVRDALIEGSDFLKGQPAHWAERIARTETMAAHNRAAYESTKAAQEQLGDMVRILSATFDSRTGADSYAVHGQIRRVDEPFDWWGGSYMQPPNRPNDREIVVPFRLSWKIPDYLRPKSDGDVSSAWSRDGRKGSPPPRPRMTTVPLELFGQEGKKAEEKAKVVVKKPVKKPLPEKPPPPPKKEQPAVSEKVARKITNEPTPRKYWESPRPGTPEHREVLKRARKAAADMEAGLGLPIDDIVPDVLGNEFKKVEAAMQEFREVIRDVVQSHGIHYNQAERLVNEGMENARSITIAPKFAMDAAGMHSRSGHVQIREDVWELATRALSKGADGKKLTPRERDALSTLFHEEIHSHSRNTSASYRKHGGALEEALTEVTARKVTGEFIGMGKVQSRRQISTGYQAEIQGIERIIREELQRDDAATYNLLSPAVDAERAMYGANDLRYLRGRAAMSMSKTLLEDAAVQHFRDRGGNFRDPDHAVREFAKHLPDAIRERVEKRLIGEKWWRRSDKKHPKWERGE